MCCQSVCVCVCPVHQTRSAALVLHFMCPESVIERSLLNPHWPFVGTISVTVCMFTNMSIISIIYDGYQASFMLYFQEEISRILSVCFSVSCPKLADRERGRPFQRQSGRSDLWRSLCREGLGMFLLLLQLLATAAGLVCFVKWMHQSTDGCVVCANCLSLDWFSTKTYQLKK